MAEPLNIPYELEHKLNFISDGFGIVRIDEPVGFDAANFVVEQEAKRYGRDVSFAGEEADFIFSTLDTKYGYYFDRLVQYRRIYGYEAQVQYILTIEGVDYVVGSLDFKTASTDELTEFKCKVIQDTNQAIIKRRNSTKVDLFSDTDTSNNPITPLVPVNILLKAKPIAGESEWKLPSQASLTLGGGVPNTFIRNFNYINEITKQEVKNTLSFLQGSGSAENFVYIEALDDITNGKLTIDINVDITRNGEVNPLQFGEVELRWLIAEDIDPTGVPANVLFQQLINENNPDALYNIDETFVLENLNIPRGYRLWVFFRTEVTVNSFLQIKTTINDGNINFEGESTAINSVTKGIRLIDAMRQVVKSINPLLSFNAPRFDVGGEWYDNFIFSGNLIRGRVTDEGELTPFVMTFKDITEYLNSEPNCDFQIGENILDIAKYDDFYTNNDIGAFLIAPDDTFNIDFNDRFTVNRFTYSFKIFNQDKDDSNTNDAVHTETEWDVANVNVENFKDVQVPFNRDPFYLETTRIKSVQENNSSLTQDDKVFINDVVPLAPNSQDSFTAPLTHFVNDDGNLQLLNDGSFNWGLLGFNEGDSIMLGNTVNAGNYTVETITNNIITLLGGAPTSIQDITLTEFIYTYSNVQYTIRTNENFQLIEGILSPNSYANLLYTPKRSILNNWSSHLSSYALYNDDIIRNDYFKNEPNLQTQYNNGSIIVEKANIERSDLDEPILTANLITSKVLCDFTEFIQVSQALRSVKGFVRIYDNDNRVRKVYPQKLDFTWKTGILEIIGEERFENQFTTVENSNGFITINEVGYPLEIVPEIVYLVDGNDIQLLDALQRPLTNYIRFDFVKINGVTYGSIDDLITAIDNL